MPKYFFIVRSPYGVSDDDRGIELANEADAREFACNLVEAVKEDDECHNKGFECVVQDGDGVTLLVVLFDTPNVLH